MGELGIGRNADDFSVDGLESLERLVERKDLGGADDYSVSSVRRLNPGAQLTISWHKSVEIGKGQ